MKAEGYLQIAPVYVNYKDEPRELRIAGFTKTTPRRPEPGSLVVKVVIDVDPAVFIPPEIRVSLDGEESEVDTVLVPVPWVEDDDEEGA